MKGLTSIYLYTYICLYIYIHMYMHTHEGADVYIHISDKPQLSTSIHLCTSLTDLRYDTHTLHGFQVSQRSGPLNSRTLIPHIIAP